MTPATSWPSRSRPSEIAKSGMPWRKLVVPSSGSMIQRWRLSVPSIVAALLGEEAEAGPRLLQLGDQHLLGAAVGGGDEIARALQRDLQVLDLAEIAGEAAAGLEHGLDHDVEKRRAGHVHREIPRRNRRRRASPPHFRPAVQADGSQFAGQRWAAAAAAWRCVVGQAGDEGVEALVLLARRPWPGSATSPRRPGRRCGRGRSRGCGRGGSGRSGCRRSAARSNQAAAAASSLAMPVPLNRRMAYSTCAGIVPSRGGRREPLVGRATRPRGRRSPRRRAAQGRTGRRGCRPRRRGEKLRGRLRSSTARSAALEMKQAEIVHRLDLALVAAFSM